MDYSLVRGCNVDMKKYSSTAYGGIGCSVGSKWPPVLRVWEQLSDNHCKMVAKQLSSVRETGAVLVELLKTCLGRLISLPLTFTRGSWIFQH